MYETLYFIKIMDIYGREYPEAGWSVRKVFAETVEKEKGKYFREAIS